MKGLTRDLYIGALIAMTHANRGYRFTIDLAGNNLRLKLQQQRLTAPPATGWLASRAGIGADVDFQRLMISLSQLRPWAAHNP
jgi:hypothetical protein